MSDYMVTLLAERLAEVSRLRAFYAASPAQIAQSMGLSVTAVEKVFDLPAFGELVEEKERLLILHLTSKLGVLNLPYQRTKYLFASGNHAQKISLARSLVTHLQPHERYPEPAGPAE